MARRAIQHSCGGLIWVHTAFMRGDYAYAKCASCGEKVSWRVPNA